MKRFFAILVGVLVTWLGGPGSAAAATTPSNVVPIPINDYHAFCAPADLAPPERGQPSAAYDYTEPPSAGDHGWFGDPARPGFAGTLTDSAPVTFHSSITTYVSPERSCGPRRYHDQ